MCFIKLFSFETFVMDESVALSLEMSRIMQTVDAQTVDAHILNAQIVKLLMHELLMQKVSWVPDDSAL